jgi:hypothetical protein
MKTTHQIVSTDEYIAEAQRLGIAQNKTLRFMYQTWWVLWVPRVVIVGFTILCVVNHVDWSLTAMFVGFLVLSFLGEWLGRAVWRRRAIELGSRGPQPLSPWVRTA